MLLFSLADSFRNLVHTVGTRCFSVKEEGLSSGNKLGVPQIQTNGPGSVNCSAIRAATVKMSWDTLARDPEAHNHPPAK